MQDRRPRPHERPRAARSGGDRISPTSLLRVASALGERERREAEEVIAEARRRYREPPSRWPVVLGAVVLLVVLVVVALGLAELAAG